MRAIVCEEYGPIEGLALRDVPVTEPGPGEVRLSVKAVGLNFPDALIVQGLYQRKPPLPFSPGAEASGIVDAVGPGVTSVRTGDRVLAITSFGAMAEQAIAREERVTVLPESMPFDVAAGFGGAYTTSHHALAQRARLGAGETLLVLGAAGGVGLAAVQLGKLMGATVIAAASSKEKLALCREKGADETIDYGREDLRDGIRRTVGADGPNVIFDPVGGDLAEPAFRSIAWEGRYLVVGFAGGTIPKMALNLPLLKGADLRGVLWSGFANRAPEQLRANMRKLLGWYAEGRLTPHIGARLPLSRAVEGLRLLIDRKALGKIVLMVDGDA